MDGGDVEQRDGGGPVGAPAPPDAPADLAPSDAARTDVLPSRRQRRRRRRTWMVAGAVAVALLLVGAGAAVLVTRDGGDGDDPAAATGGGRDRRRAATTTTTAAAATTTTASPGAAPGAPAGPEPAVADEPEPPVIPIEQGGAVVSLNPGSCGWDGASGVLRAAGTLTNRSGEVAGIEVTVVWKDAAGADLEEGFTLEVLEHGETIDWEVETPWFDTEDPDAPPPPVTCSVTIA